LLGGVAMTDKTFPQQAHKKAGRKVSFYPAGKLPLRDLSRLISRFTRKDPSLIVASGIGRDAAVISVSNGTLVAKTDPITFAAEEIGRYAVHINANDIAAMGGTPRWFLAALLLPAGKTGRSDVEAIFAQISQACKELDILPCGGHTEITPAVNQPIVVGHMLGEADRANLPSVERIRAGDGLILTKGIAVEGTAVIARERSLARILSAADIRRCRRLLDDPGISVVCDAVTARAAADVHAMHDPTEGGLATGILEMARGANLGITVWLDKIFVYPETDLLCRKLGLNPLGLLASGALLIAVRPGESSQVIAALKKKKIPAEVIGHFRPLENGIRLKAGGKIRAWPHFERDEVARYFETSGEHTKNSPQRAPRAQRKLGKAR
ncbi:MAG TPA: AIR synthase-related protein, partial [Thermodesulfobacteriota bacterium]|nr:AIR synthase-related protein [Thermodesulfobacteriota bacterium]